MEREITVFEKDGFTPDIKIISFNDEFHVNSSVLKMNSKFFRTFLDCNRGESAGAEASAESAFKYEYILKGGENNNDDNGDDAIYGLQPLAENETVSSEVCFGRYLVWF